MKIRGANMNLAFTLYKIKTLYCKNRFMRSATWEAKATEDGHMTSALYEVYENLAKNEVGFICTGMTRITEEECANEKMLGIYDDSFIEEYKHLTQMVHGYGAKIMMQIAYGGTKTTYKTENRRIFAPSDIPEKTTGTQGISMTQEDIDFVVKAHGQAAKRVKEAGFDAIELHAAHFYLLNQFLSPYYNHRTDEYGGRLENRVRFLKECYEEVRKVVGEDFPVFVKLPCSDFMENGFTFSECRVVCEWLEAWGVDAVEITGNNYMQCGSLAGETLEEHVIQKDGYFSDFAGELAKERKMYLFVTGGFCTLESIEKVLSNGEITGVGISRPFFTEPNLIALWKENMKQEVKCIRCEKCRTSFGNECTVFK